MKEVRMKLVQRVLAVALAASTALFIMAAKMGAL